MGDALESPARHHRTLKLAFMAVGRWRNYRSIYRVFARCREPIAFLRRYIGNTGRYPAEIAISTPAGPVSINVFSPDDIQTVNEIFFRGDYDTPTRDTVIVDFGSNIGVSAIYFLTRNRDAFVYCHEPLKQNIERFERNLRPFSGRYHLSAMAVGEADGEVDFGYEPTGRYGGVGRNDTGQSVRVECRDSNNILQEIIDRHGGIDLLKVDIETLEEAVVRRIPAPLAAKIRHILVEYRFAYNPLTETHDKTERRTVTLFTARR